MNSQKTDTKTAPGSEFGDLRRAKRLGWISSHHSNRKRLFERVYCGQAGPRQCIKAFCLECNGWDEESIDNCPMTACPLWNLRPFRSGKPAPAVCPVPPAAVGPLPPILTLEELLAQVERDRENGVAEHLMPSKDGLC